MLSPENFTMSVAPFLFVLFSLLPFTLSIPESEALIKFKKSLTNAQRLESWVPNTNPCGALWEGIMCDGGILTGIHLSNMGLAGTIDIDALSQLKTLRTVSFVNNTFSGTIPEFNRLTALKALYLARNHFIGEIPTDYFSKMEMLKKVWLSANKFNGKIPISLGKLAHLMELHLEQNDFTGPIPDISQKTITSFDLSNNKLEGTIPPNMARFGSQSFRDNPMLCGPPLSIDCAQLKAKSELKQGHSTKSITALIIFIIIFIIIIVSFFLRTRQKGQKFKKLRKDSLDDVVPARLPSTNRRSVDPIRIPSQKGVQRSLSQKGGATLTHRGSTKATSDLVVVNEHKGVFGLADLMKAAAEVLGSGGLGSAYKAVMDNGVSVVVKRMREMNKMSRDTFDGEIRKLGRLDHPNVLTLLAYHYRKDEKLLVSEFVPRGSLLSILHGEKGLAHAELNWPIRLKIIKGVARGLEYLHNALPSDEVPHGNLKSTNILLNTDYEPVLSDYALYPLINTTQAIHSLSSYKCPEATQYQQVCPKSDVFSLGIVILEIITGKYPSQYNGNLKGGTDVVQMTKSAISENREIELIDPEISEKCSNSIEEMVKLIRVGADCTESSLDERIDLREAIRKIEEIHV